MQEGLIDYVIQCVQAKIFLTLIFVLFTLILTTILNKDTEHILLCCVLICREDQREVILALTFYVKYLCC